MSPVLLHLSLCLCWVFEDDAVMWKGFRSHRFLLRALSSAYWRHNFDAGDVLIVLSCWRVLVYCLSGMEGKYCRSCELNKALEIDRNNSPQEVVISYVVREVNRTLPISTISNPLCLECRTSMLRRLSSTQKQFHMVSWNRTMRSETAIPLIKVKKSHAAEVYSA